MNVQHASYSILLLFKVPKVSSNFNPMKYWAHSSKSQSRTFIRKSRYLKLIRDPTKLNFKKKCSRQFQQRVLIPEFWNTKSKRVLVNSSMLKQAYSFAVSLRKGYFAKSFGVNLIPSAYRHQLLGFNSWCQEEG